MIKLKSNRGAAKRFKVTGSGRIKHRQGFRSHILTKKSSKRKRQLRAMKMLSDRDHNAVERMLNGS